MEIVVWTFPFWAVAAPMSLAVSISGLVRVPQIMFFMGFWGVWGGRDVGFLVEYLLALRGVGGGFLLGRKRFEDSSFLRSALVGYRVVWEWMLGGVGNLSRDSPLLIQVCLGGPHVYLLWACW